VDGSRPRLQLAHTRHAPKTTPRSPFSTHQRRFHVSTTAERGSETTRRPPERLRTQPSLPLRPSTRTNDSADTSKNSRTRSHVHASRMSTMPHSTVSSWRLRFSINAGEKRIR
jgi:hypothetical protein